MTRIVAGPYCTMTLADLGADVWKIERPDGGDEARGWQPPAVAGVSTYFLSVNRSKKSVAIDLKTAAGAQLVRDLAERADVLVANFLPDSLRGLGLDYASLAARSPRLIHCTITGYGATGSRAGDAGFDFVIQGESGLMAITGEPGGEPVKVGVAVTDVIAGMNAVQAILAALIARGRTGRGQSIDIALLDGAIAAQPNMVSAHSNAGTGTERWGNAHASIVPYQTFTCADGAIIVAIGNDRQFRILCERVLKRPELAADDRFATNAGRVRNRAEIVAELEAVFALRPAAALLAELKAANLPAGEVRTVAAAVAAPEVVERGTIVEVEDPALGRLRFAASPLHLSDTPVRPAAPPPRVGEHTRDVLSAVLGLRPADLDRLQAALVIHSAKEP